VVKNSIETDKALRNNDRNTIDHSIDVVCKNRKTALLLFSIFGIAQERKI